MRGRAGRSSFGISVESCGRESCQSYLEAARAPPARRSSVHVLHARSGCMAHRAARRAVRAHHRGLLEIGRENALHYTASGKNHPCEFSLVPLSSTRHLDHYAHDFDEFRTARSLSQVQWRDLTKRCNFERNLPREPRRPMGCARAAMPVRQVSRLLSHPKFSRH